ncbi:Pupal cuticle protein 27 [Penaeus vannamei]|uniref:Pupal cuticle protein 27 n=1 Tax=Penaeus vannamei TaxID=6689 RepID=A0A3R7Q1X6_PENVA|nr:Pupal cuticle protein 27 [Penaeus vannamei]
MAKWRDFVLFSSLLASIATSFSDNVGRFDPDHYYILQSGGFYKYGHQRDGTYEKAEASQPGNVLGEFGFRDASGTDYKLEYTADHRGFQPSGDHLPLVHTRTALENLGVGVVSSDGGYTFNYETDSSDRKESADPNLNVKGRFSFQGTDGRRKTIRYRAGADTGFVAQGDHIPVSPEIPSGSQVVPQTRSGPSAPAPSSAPASPAQVSSSSSPDGSYSFNYETDSSDREESADPNLNVKGRFSFQGTDGRRRTIRYRAGAAQVSSSSSPDGSYSFNYETDSSDREESADPNLNVKGRFSFQGTDGRRRTIRYRAGAAHVSSSSSPDGSYSFNYETDSSDREESADPNLNVKGRFSFQGTDGRRRTIRYRAGAVTEKRVPIQTSMLKDDSVSKAQMDAAELFGIEQEQVLGLLLKEITFLSPRSTSTVFSTAPSSAPASPAQVSSSSSPDGSYSFNYETDSSDREESADPNLNVKGRFSFQGTDGRRRTIRYRAGAGTGFVAQGDHIPVSPEVPSGSQIVPQTRVALQHQHRLQHPASPAQVSSSSSPDGSYSFNYETDSSDREESAIQTSMLKEIQFPGTDGRRRTIRYRAGAGTGDREESADPNLNVKDDSVSKAQTDAAELFGIEQEQVLGLLLKEITFLSPGAQVSSSSSPDGSYSFNYETDSSDREESADPNLNVKGRFSFQGTDGRRRTIRYRAGAVTRRECDPNLNVKGRFSFQGTDGRRRTIRYRAGAGTGFVAQGDHIPVSPEVPSGSQIVPQTRSSPSAPSTVFSTSPRLQHLHPQRK